MVRSKRTISTFVSMMGLFGLVSHAFGQSSSSATAGQNPNALPSQPPIVVAWGPAMSSWKLQVDLVFDPSAGPMEKQFQSPIDAAGLNILLDALQPLPLPIWEDFALLPLPGTAGFVVTDWHEKIHTPGWEWVLPGDPRFPSLFPPGSSLITHNGQPWPSTPMPMDPVDPTSLWVVFPPIAPNNVLDVHKALLWVGTPDNRIWGDYVSETGNFVDERFIEVGEHPTGVPEPATTLLLCVGAVGLFVRCRR